MTRASLYRASGVSTSVRCLSGSSWQLHPTRTSNTRPAGRVPPSNTNTTAAYQRQRRSEWVFVGVAGSAAAFGGWYYWANIRKRNGQEDASAKALRSYSTQTSSAPSTFSIPARVRGPGEQSIKVITPLTAAEVDARLRANERSTIVDRPQGACLIARYDTNCVPSNDPTEDRHAEVIVERDRGIDEPRSLKANKTTTASNPRGDLCFFTVMDGHGGWHTASILSQKLIAFVALELDKVFRETGEYAQMARNHPSISSAVWHSLFGGKDSKSPSSYALDGNPEIVKRALVKGFRGLDKEITTTPLELLKQYELNLAAASSQGTAPTANDPKNSLSSLAHSIWPSTVQGSSKTSSLLGASPASAREAVLAALSGSCAQMVYIDSARRDLYVATTGDSRAVAGYWDERAGRWEVEALSVDQTGRNPNEVRRIQREHPADEASTVIQRGRVLGGLEPTRAFGDARYKWDRDVQQRVVDAFLPNNKSVRGAPRSLKTPPYVTAEPVVITRKIPMGHTEEHANNESLMAAAQESIGSLSGSHSSRELRFIIMATDGLWDLMSDQEAVGLVAGHLAGIRGTVLAADLQQQCFEPAKARNTLSSSAENIQADSSSVEKPRDSPNHPLLRTPNHLQRFTFQDDNLSTHLVRNALGGAARERVAGLLAIPSPESRRYRDDVRTILTMPTNPRLLSSMFISLTQRHFAQFTKQYLDFCAKQNASQRLPNNSDHERDAHRQAIDSLLMA